MTTTEQSPRQLPEDNFDPLAQAHIDAVVPTTGEQIYHDMLGEKVDPAAAADFAAYLETRPELAKSPIASDPNVVVDPKTGKVTIGETEYFDNLRKAHYNKTTNGEKESDQSNEELYQIFGNSKKIATQEYVRTELESRYSDMKLSELAKEWAKIELISGTDSNNLLWNDVQEAIAAKMSQMQESGETKRNQNGMTVEAQDALFNRVLKIKDAYIKEHGGKPETKEPGTNSESSRVTSKPFESSKADAELDGSTERMATEAEGYVPNGDGKVVRKEDLAKDGIPIEDFAKYGELPESLIKIENSLDAKRSSLSREMARAKGRGHLFKSSRELLDAIKRDYEDTIKEYQIERAKFLIEKGQTTEEIKADLMMQYSRENRLLCIQQREDQIGMAEDLTLSRFYNFYAKLGGKRLFSLGTVKKSLVLAGVTLPVGFAVGAAVSAVAGPIFGAAAGFGAARAISKGMVGAHIEKRAANSKASIEDQMSIEDQINANAVKTYKVQERNLKYDSDPSTLTFAHIQETMDAIRRNRNRMLGAAAIGAVFGSVGAVIGSEIFHHGATTLSGHHPKAAISNAIHKSKISIHRPGLHVGRNPIAAAAASNQLTHLPSGANLTGVGPYGNEYPWDVFADKYGAAQATPKIEDLVAKARDLGWKINPNPQGNGFTSIQINGGKPITSSLGIADALNRLNLV